MIRRTEEVCVYENKFFRVFDDKVSFNGTLEGRYFRIKPANAKSSVIVFALTENMELLVTREFRYAQQEYVISTAAGQVESGQSIYEAALAELQQEMGLSCKTLMLLGSIHELPSILDNETFIFLAADVTPSATGNAPEATEVLSETLLTLSLEQVHTMIRNNEITHGGFLAGFFKLTQFLQRT